MNVFYVGLDNPVSVSVPGVQPSDVTVSLSGPGQLVKKTGTSLYTNFLQWELYVK